jgi:superfamily II DNA/RNA helicase
MLAMPEIAQDKNVLCAAETGSGKTLTYIAPIVSRLRDEEEQGFLRFDRRPRAIVIVPNRELVHQVVVCVKRLF